MFGFVLNRFFFRNFGRFSEDKVLGLGILRVFFRLFRIFEGGWFGLGVSFLEFLNNLGIRNVVEVWLGI